MLRVWLVALLLAAGFATSASAAAVPKDWVGVHADGPLTAKGANRGGEWKKMGRSGAAFARTAFYWRDLETTQGAVRLGATDKIVLSAARNGLGILPVVLMAPKWARKYPTIATSPPRDPADYAAFVKRLVERYGPDGSLWRSHPEVPVHPIRDWQIWNEPNFRFYWYDQPFAPTYVELLKAVRPVLKAADPGSRLILAGLPNRSWEMLHTIYQAGGKGLFDAVAAHPYGSSVKTIVRVLKLIRAEMDEQGDTALPIWVTEFSWPGSLGKTKQPQAWERTDSDAAKLCASTLQTLAKERRRLNIEHVVWYTWLSEEGTGEPLWGSYSGLRRVRKGKTVSSPILASFEKTVKSLTGARR